MELTSLLKKNLQQIETVQPKLAAILRKHLESVESLPVPVAQESEAGSWIRGLSPISFFNPEKVEYAIQEKSALFFVFGVGVPPYLTNLFRSLPKGTLAVVVFEPNIDLLVHTLSLSSVFAALPAGCHLTFICPEEKELVKEAMDYNIRPMGGYIVTEAETVAHPGEVEAFGERFRALKELLAREVRIHVDVLGNSSEDTLLGFRQMVLNLPWILETPNMGLFKEKLEGLPFVCVASGPSLEKNIHLLKGQEDKCVIIVADTALRRVLNEGILPHIVVTLERPHSMYVKYFRPVLDEYPKECRKILLVAQSVCPPQTIGRWPGPKAVVGKIEVPVDQWLIGDLLCSNLMRSGMSVSHMALVLSLVWGAGSVALIGQDLSFAEDGRSHASLTADENAQAVERRRGQTDLLEIAGSLGGTVKTTKIWFMFLQILEAMLRDVTVDVFDCTEGGALISGTKVLSFSDYIEEHFKDIFPSTPSQLFNEFRIHRILDLGEVLRRIDNAFDVLALCAYQIDELERKVGRAISAALAPERRRKIAGEVAEDLDRLNGMHKVLAFVGQSYSNLAGIAISKARWMEDVEEVRAWERVHGEIIEAHRVNLAFLIQWLKYAKSVIALLETGIVIEPIDSSVEAYERFVGIWKDSGLETGGIEPWSESMGRLNLHLACCDPVDDAWNDDVRWQIASFLHRQGRAEEATCLMDLVFSHFQGTEKPVPTIVAFLKEYARIVSTHDLCFIPQYRKAKLLLDNARNWAPEDPEIPELIDDILGGLKTYYEDLQRFGLVGRAIDFDFRRLQAELTLNRKDLDEALRLVWELILDYAPVRPDNVRPLAQWLIKTLFDCREAAESSLHDTVGYLLDEVASHLGLFTALEVSLPASILEYLAERGGLKVALQTADNQNSKGTE